MKSNTPPLYETLNEVLFWPNEYTKRTSITTAAAAAEKLEKMVGNVQYKPTTTTFLFSLVQTKSETIIYIILAGHLISWLV